VISEISRGVIGKGKKDVRFCYKAQSVQVA
jgi:hypothetical protein